jgi:hypothetical protein
MVSAKKLQHLCFVQTKLFERAAKVVLQAARDAWKVDSRSHYGNLGTQTGKLYIKLIFTLLFFFF